jgi:hypothetical protein
VTLLPTWEDVPGGSLKTYEVGVPLVLLIITKSLLFDCITNVPDVLALTRVYCPNVLNNTSESVLKYSLSHAPAAVDISVQIAVISVYGAIRCTAFVLVAPNTQTNPELLLTIVYLEPTV